MPGNDAPEGSDDGLEHQAAKLQEKYGEEAATYAETRAEAADLRGARRDAEHWQQVEELVDDDVEPGREA